MVRAHTPRVCLNFSFNVSDAFLLIRNHPKVAHMGPSFMNLYVKSLFSAAFPSLICFNFSRLPSVGLFFVFSFVFSVHYEAFPSRTTLFLSFHSKRWCWWCCWWWWWWCRWFVNLFAHLFTATFHSITAFLYLLCVSSLLIDVCTHTHLPCLIDSFPSLLSLFMMLHHITPRPLSIAPSSYPTPLRRQDQKSRLADSHAISKGRLWFVLLAHEKSLFFSLFPFCMVLLSRKSRSQMTMVVLWLGFFLFAIFLFIFPLVRLAFAVLTFSPRLGRCF